MSPAAISTRDAAPYVRAEYEAIRLYAPDRRPTRVDLSDNTNRWGMSPASRAALRDASDAAAVRYPSLYAEGLKSAIANYIGVPAPNIVTGCGSDDVLDSAIRACTTPGDLLVAPSPVFPMVPLFARMNGVRFMATPLSPRLEVDPEALLAGAPRIVYLCSPNNPTGTVLPRAFIRDILERTAALVIVDEAYVEFGGESVVDLVAESPRLLVVRTLSKAFGLAGLRVGYAVGAPSLVQAVEKSRGPYKVNALAEAAAVAGLTEGLPWVRARIADVVALRGALTAELEARGVQVLPSGANFVLGAVRDAERLALAMRDRDVAVRPFTNLESNIPALRATGGSALRISVGPRAELDAMFAAFDEASAACA
jgi:histidinol-phosphate aminotransferase